MIHGEKPNENDKSLMYTDISLCICFIYFLCLSSILPQGGSRVQWMYIRQVVWQVVWQFTHTVHGDMKDSGHYSIIILFLDKQLFFCYIVFVSYPVLFW